MCWRSFYNENQQYDKNFESHGDMEEMLEVLTDFLSTKKLFIEDFIDLLEEKHFVGY